MVMSVYRNHVAYNRKFVYARDNFECGYCGTKDDLTIDHYIPRAKGGKNIYENVVSCCFTCNNRKGDKTPEEVGLKLKKNLYAPTIKDLFRFKLKKLGLNEKDLLPKFD